MPPASSMLIPALLAVCRAKARHAVPRRRTRCVRLCAGAGVIVSTIPSGWWAQTTVMLAGGANPRAERSRNSASTMYVSACACSGATSMSSMSSMSPRTSMLRPAHALPTRSIRLHQERSDPARTADSESMPRGPCNCRACRPSARTSSDRACNATTPGALDTAPSASAHSERALEIPPRSCANAPSASRSSSASLGDCRDTFDVTGGIMRRTCWPEDGVGLREWMMTHELSKYPALSAISS